MVGSYRPGARDRRSPGRDSRDDRGRHSDFHGYERPRSPTRSYHDRSDRYENYGRDQGDYDRGYNQQPSSRSYQFGHAQPPPHSQFSFQPYNAPRFPSRADGERTRGPDLSNAARRREAGGGDRNGYKQGHADRNRGNNYGSNKRQNRGGYVNVGAAERKLLTTTNRGTTPPQLEGMNDGEAGARYTDIIGFTDDEEEHGADDTKAEENGGTEPAKPKWSNPETYTALPPPDEPQRKRKDMVKLIRNARVDGVEKSESAAANALASNHDFISLDFGDEGEEELIKPGVPGAPRGPAAERADLPARPPTSRDSANDASIQQAAQLQAGETKIHVTDSGLSVESRLSTLKRKRVEDLEDLETRELMPPNKSLKKGPSPSGVVTSDWVFRGRDNEKQLAIPWIRAPDPYRVKANVRLHQEILDFHDFVCPRAFEVIVREHLLTRLRQVMDKLIPGCEVHIFGSFAAGLFLPDADMDVAVLSRDYVERGRHSIATHRSRLNRLAQGMKSAGFAENVEVIAGAKVPIIKVVDRLSKLKVDISFENSTGLVANNTFRQWKEQYPAMPVLVMIIKQFLLMRGLNDVAVGGIGGFSITCLVTSLLQNMPRVQTGELDPSRNLGEVLIEFLDFYGNRFNYYNTALMMDPPGFDNKARIKNSGRITKAQPDRLMIIDPNKSNNDISGGSRLFGLIASKFSEANAMLLDNISRYSQPDSRTVSLLAWMLGGNYDSFLWYRRHLKQVYEETWGPIPSDQI